MKLLVAVICIVCAVVFLSSCATFTHTEPGGTVVTNRGVDWDEVNRIITILQPYAQTALTAARRWEQARDEREAQMNEDEREALRQDLARVAGSAAFIIVYQQATTVGKPTAEAATAGISAANSAIALLYPKSPGYAELMQDWLFNGKPETDYPSDVELALDVLCETLPELMAQEGGES